MGIVKHTELTGSIWMFLLAKFGVGRVLMTTFTDYLGTVSYTHLTLPTN